MPYTYIKNVVWELDFSKVTMQKPNLKNIASFTDLQSMS